MPDLTATILDVANASASYPIDGRVISFENQNASSQDTGKATQTIVEYWNGALEEGIYAFAGE